MIVVTGGAGFIGSNIVKVLNERGIDDIIVVDDLRDGAKYRNLSDLQIADYFDKDEFIRAVRAGRIPARRVRVLFHQGACTDTTEWDGRYMMNENFEYSKVLLHYCIANHIQFIYASSAAVYGLGPGFSEESANERPLNVYGYSKLVFDQYVRRHLHEADSQVIGLRYFNVYGPREAHKGPMASMAWQLHRQVGSAAVARLFCGSDGFGDGEQRRDFIHVRDVADVNLWFMEHPGTSGIFNVGTGSSASFNELAQAVVEWHGRGTIEYIPFPESLQGRYQNHTEADITALRHAGYSAAFRAVSQGVPDYLDELADS